MSDEKIEPVEFESEMWGVFDTEQDEDEPPLALYGTETEARESLLAAYCQSLVALVRVRGIHGNDPERANVAPPWPEIPGTREDLYRTREQQLFAEVDRRVAKARAEIADAIDEWIRNGVSGPALIRALRGAP